MDSYAKPPRLAAIVLAAGLSARMGGPNKLLALYCGKPLVSHALDLVASFDFAQRIVVTGRDSEAVSRVIPAGFEAVFNSRFIDGMGSSLAAGVAALRPDIGGVLIFLGDMPDIRSADVLAIIDAFDTGLARCIAIPVHEGERGHPVLFGAAHIAALGALDGDRGARSVILANEHAVIEIAASAGVVRDIDTAGGFDDAR